MPHRHPLTSLTVTMRTSALVSMGTPAPHGGGACSPDVVELDYYSLPNFGLPRHLGAPESTSFFDESNDHPKNGALYLSIKWKTIDLWTNVFLNTPVVHAIRHVVTVRYG